MEYTVKQVEYHRNGISGVGFYVGLLDDPENGEMVVIRFPGSECRTAVLNIERLAQTEDESIRIGFGCNSWRGDYYDEAMLAAIRHNTITTSREFFPDMLEEELQRRTDEEMQEFLRDNLTEGL